MNRRTFLRVALAGAAGSLPLAACGGAAEPAAKAPAAGGAAGEPIRVGFIPLTDCASVVMAGQLGYYKEAGLDVTVSKEASWANVRDKLLTGELHAAHCLFGMPFSVYTGVGGVAGKELLVAMVLNANGQGITLGKELAPYAGYGKLDGLSAAVATLKEPTFAMTFPGGTHDMWLRYLLAAAKVDQNAVKIVPIPPPQMVANMKVGAMNGFSVGEPWNGMAVKEEVGYTYIATQDIWADHPEKALVVNPDFAKARRDDLKRLMGSVLRASQWLDQPANRTEAAKVIGAQSYVNAPADVIDARLAGQYDLGGGLGEKKFADDYMLFHKGGAVNFPRKGHAVWFMAQYVRFGLLKTPPDYQAVAERLILQDLYAEVASEHKVSLPDDDLKPFTLKLDGQTFDPGDPAGSIG